MCILLYFSLHEERHNNALPIIYRVSNQSIAYKMITLPIKLAGYFARSFRSTYFNHTFKIIMMFTANVKEVEPRNEAVCIYFRYRCLFRLPSLHLILETASCLLRSQDVLLQLFYASEHKKSEINATIVYLFIVSKTCY